MKKSILIMSLLMITVVSSAFANKNGVVNDKVSTAFNKDFSLAREVSWETGKDLVKATFKLNEQVLFAYYTPSGELMAVTRNILSVQLPISLMTEIKRDYSNYWITELFEMSNTQGSVYYMTLENSDGLLLLKADNNRDWQTYKRIKKNIE